MTARRLFIATLVVLATSVALRARGLAQLWRSDILRVELSRWDDPEFASGVEDGLGLWLGQSPQNNLKIDLVDDSAQRGVAKLEIAGEAAQVLHAPSADELRPVVEQLARHLGSPGRVFIVATDWSVDRAQVSSIRALLAEATGKQSVVVRAANRAAEGGSPTVPSGRNDWVIIATEAAREHLGALLRVRGRKIFFLPPYREALASSHPDLWFVAEWDPAVEYFPGRKISSCAALAHTGVDTGQWPLSALPLKVMAALDSLNGGSAVVRPLPLTLVGPPDGGPGPPALRRAGPALPACSKAQP